ncbi:unnamed protein product, partial [Nesidiocoris tenuis]
MSSHDHDTSLKTALIGVEPVLLCYLISSDWMPRIIKIELHLSRYQFSAEIRQITEWANAVCGGGSLPGKFGTAGTAGGEPARCAGAAAALGGISLPFGEPPPRRGQRRESDFSRTQHEIHVGTAAPRDRPSRIRSGAHLRVRRLVFRRR